jgi:hypothetical protein
MISFFDQGRNIVDRQHLTGRRQVVLCLEPAASRLTAHEILVLPSRIRPARIAIAIGIVRAAGSLYASKATANRAPIAVGRTSTGALINGNGFAGKIRSAQEDIASGNLGAFAQSVDGIIDAYSVQSQHWTLEEQSAAGGLRAKWRPVALVQLSRDRFFGPARISRKTRARVWGRAIDTMVGQSRALGIDH